MSRGSSTHPLTRSLCVAQATAVMEHIRLVRGTAQPFLVIAPLTTLGHWKREIENWTDMNVVSYEGSAADRELCMEHEVCLRRHVFWVRPLCLRLRIQST